MKQNSSTHERLADRLANILTMLNMGSHLSSALLHKPISKAYYTI